MNRSRCPLCGRVEPGDGKFETDELCPTCYVDEMQEPEADSSEDEMDIGFDRIRILPPRPESKE